MNLLISHTGHDDKAFEKEGHIFLGAGFVNGDSGEIHVWLKKGASFPECSINTIKEISHE